MTRADRVKYGLKVAVSHALYYSGLLQLWQAVVVRRKAVVLMYHRVLTTDERNRTGSHPALVVDRDTFATQMAVLKRRFTVLSVAEFASYMERGIPFPNSSCVITFDDGWRDNFTNALPILQKHDLPALVFLPVNYIGSRRVFWQEALTHLLIRAVHAGRRDASTRAALNTLLAPSKLEHLLETTEDDPRPHVIAAIGTQKRLTRAAMEELLGALATTLGVALEELADVDGFLSWDEVCTMSRNKVAFGGHGVDHLLLTHVSSEVAAEEIRGSKSVVERRLNEPVLTFSYPNGYLTPAIVGQVRDAGYRLAFVTGRGFVSCDDDRFMVRRLNVHETATGSAPMFLARMVGLW